MKKYEKYAQKLTNKSRDNIKDVTQTNQENDNMQQSKKQLPSEAQNRLVFSTVDENFGFLNSIFGSSMGLIGVKYDILAGKVQIGVAYIESIVDMQVISSHIIEPLVEGGIDGEMGLDDILMQMQSKFIHVPHQKKSNQMQQVVDSLLNGYTVVFIEAANDALMIGSRKIDKRAIEQPNNEVTILASMESFVEDIGTNCSMVIRRLPTPDLHFEEFVLGRLSHTKVKMLWLDGISNQKVVDELRSRVQKIDVDLMEGIGSLAEFIKDKPMSIFPTYRQTQRPDVVAKKLTDGYAAILCDNSPFALVAPMFFLDNFKSMDDYAENTFVSSFLRGIRLFAFILATLISPLYLAFVTYNQNIVPPALAVNIATGRDSIPFPSIVEILILSLSITIIREASLRLPGSVGYFIGALSAVVIGQSAVNAGYVSASVIIVVAISAISAFAISNTTLVYPARLISYVMIGLAGVFGMFGVINGLILVIWHMVSIRSFGMPYLYPLVPFDREAMKDTFFRAPYKNIRKRENIMVHDNRLRMGDSGIQNRKKGG